MKQLTIDNISASLISAPEILGKDKYFNSAVILPLFEKNNQLHILFEKRASEIRQGGEVSFPGGEFDASTDSNLQDTAVRETNEELGIAKSKVEVLGKFGTLVAPMGVSIDVFVSKLQIESLSELLIDKNEVEKIFSLTLTYFFDNEPEEFFVNLEVHPNYIDKDGNQVDLLPVSELGLPEHYSKPWRRGKHRILVYKTNEEIIWGITAEILFEFVKVIRLQK